MKIQVNNEEIDLTRYEAFHQKRFERTLEEIRRLGGGRIVEFGGHPWAMTARLLAEPSVDLMATISAEEVTAWPDELPVTEHRYEIVPPSGARRQVVNYSANIERTLLDLDLQVDLVLACEILEHMTRAPHMLLLNANAMLKPGGRLLVTTPNGAQFRNPLRVQPAMPAFRYSSYSRHNYVFSMEGLTDLVSCCGFEVERMERFSPYSRAGLTRAYYALGRLPIGYAQEKFTQSLLVVGRKVAAIDAATRLPKVYVPSLQWERVSQGREAGREMLGSSLPRREE